MEKKSLEDILNSDYIMRIGDWVFKSTWSPPVFGVAGLLSESFYLSQEKGTLLLAPLIHIIPWSLSIPTIRELFELGADIPRFNELCMSREQFAQRRRTKAPRLQRTRYLLSTAVGVGGAILGTTIPHLPDNAIPSFCLAALPTYLLSTVAAAQPEKTATSLVDKVLESPLHIGLVSGAIMGISLATYASHLPLLERTYWPTVMGATFAGIIAYTAKLVAGVAHKDARKAIKLAVKRWYQEHMKRNPEEAIENQKKLLEQPTSNEVQARRRTHLARLYRRIDQEKQAQEEQQRALALLQAPYVPKSHLDFMQEYTGIALGADIFQRLRLLYPTTAQHAVDLYIRGKTERAKIALQRMIRKERTDPYIRLLYAHIAQKKDAMQHAVDLFLEKDAEIKEQTVSANTTALFEDPFFGWKIIGKYAPHEDALKEYALAKRLQEYVEPFYVVETPTPIGVYDRGDHSMYVMELAPGCALDEYLANEKIPPEPKVQAVRVASHFLLFLQRQKDQLPFRDFRKDVLHKIQDRPRDQYCRIEDAIDALLPDQTRPCVRDYDGHDRNFIVTPWNTLMKIDNEDKSTGINAERDIAKLQNYSTAVSAAWKKWFIMKYPQLDWLEYIKSVPLIAFGAYSPLERQKRLQAQDAITENAYWALDELFRQTNDGRYRKLQALLKCDTSSMHH